MEVTLTVSSKMISIENLFMLFVVFIFMTTYTADISASTSFQTIHRHVQSSCHSMFFLIKCFLFNCFTSAAVQFAVFSCSLLNDHLQATAWFLSFTLRSRERRKTKKNFQSQFLQFTLQQIYYLFADLNIFFCLREKLSCLVP